MLSSAASEIGLYIDFGRLFLVHLSGVEGLGKKVTYINYKVVGLETKIGKE